MPNTHLKVASGVIIVETNGYVWVPSPTNGFGGYPNTIGPKGKVERNLTMRQNAIKEAFEETGLVVKLGEYAVDVERTTSMTRYFFAERVGGNPTDMGWETQAVHLVSPKILVDFMHSDIDKMVAELLVERITSK